MPLKRRNHGRGKKHKGCADCVNCYNCGRVYPKDKAIKRYNMRKIVDASSKRDIEEATAYPGNQSTLETKFIYYNIERLFVIPKLYMKIYYCVSCAIHLRIVRVRSAENRKIRISTKVRKVRTIIPFC